MAAGRIEIKHVFPGETDYIIWTLRKTSNLLTLVPATFYDGTTTTPAVTKFVYAAPHPESIMLLTDIEPTMYLVTPYRSADGIALDEELPMQLAVDASSGAQFTTTKFEYVVNRGLGSAVPGEVWNDPVSDQNELRDERLNGKTYWIEERGTGIMGEDEITDRSDDGGGFDFATPDKVFEDSARYFAIVQNALDTAPSVSGGSDFNDIILISEDMGFDAGTMNGKVLVSAYAGAAKVVTVTMGNLATIADCKFRIQTHSGTQRYIAMQLDSGDVVSLIGIDTWNVLYFGKGEVVEVLIKSNVMYITSDVPGYDLLGQRVWGDKVEKNTLRRDGTLYNQADVPRLMQWIDTLGGGLVVTEAVWAGFTIDTLTGDTIYPYKSFFARDNVGGTIRVPDDRNKSIRSLLADTGDTDRATQGPGGYQHYRTGMKAVKVGVRDGAGGSSTGTLSGTGFSGQDNYSSFITENGSTQNHIRFNNASDAYTGANETRSSNVGLIPLIRI